MMPQMPLNDQYRMFWLWCMAIGVPYAWDTVSESPYKLPWDGTKMCGLDENRNRFDIAVLCHELAHWACASVRDRLYADFQCNGGAAGVSEKLVEVVGVLLHRRLDPHGAWLHQIEHWPDDDKFEAFDVNTYFAGQRAVQVFACIGIDLLETQPMRHKSVEEP
jgi:hypothetical protein